MYCTDLEETQWASYQENLELARKKTKIGTCVKY